MESHTTPDTYAIPFPVCMRKPAPSGHTNPLSLEVFHFPKHSALAAWGGHGRTPM